MSEEVSRAWPPEIGDPVKVKATGEKLFVQSTPDTPGSAQGPGNRFFGLSPSMSSPFGDYYPLEEIEPLSSAATVVASSDYSNAVVSNTSEVKGMYVGELLEQLYGVARLAQDLVSEEDVALQNAARDRLRLALAKLDIGRAPPLPSQAP